MATINIVLTGVTPTEHADMRAHAVAEACVGLQVPALHIGPVKDQPDMVAAIFPMPRNYFHGGAVSLGLPWGRAKVALYGRLVVDAAALTVPAPPALSGSDDAPLLLPPRLASALARLLDATPEALDGDEDVQALRRLVLATYAVEPPATLHELLGGSPLRSASLAGQEPE